jgi:hypothetical protein
MVPRPPHRNALEGTRTLTPFQAAVFETAAYTNFATRAEIIIMSHTRGAKFCNDLTSIGISRIELERPPYQSGRLTVTSYPNVCRLGYPRHLVNRLKRVFTISYLTSLRLLPTSGTEGSRTPALRASTGCSDRLSYSSMHLILWGLVVWPV